MPGYKDWEMLNNSVTGLGETVARRRKENTVNQREEARLGMERELRDNQREREDRIDKEGNRRFDLTQQREDRRDTAATVRADAEGKRLDMAHQPHITADFYDDENGTSMTFTGTPEQLDTMQAQYLQKTGRELKVSNKKAFAATFSVGGSQFSFQDKAQADKFASDLKANHGIDVYSQAAPKVETTPGGDEFIIGPKGQILKGAKAPDAGYTSTSVHQTPPPAFSPAGTPPTSLTNVTTRVPNGANVPHGTNTATGKRIKVKSPDGKTGTMDASEKLPEGWKLIED